MGARARRLLRLDPGLLAGAGAARAGGARPQAQRDDPAGEVERAKEVPDDVVHLFAAVGRYDRIVEAITERFGGLTDALNARANAAQPGPLPRDLIQDIRRVPHSFRSFSRAEA